MDFSEAFDRINHNVLINKLMLSVRLGSVNGGVPQGTELGSILFLVIIKDLKLRSTNMWMWKYVDDVSLS